MKMLKKLLFLLLLISNLRVFAQAEVSVSAKSAIVIDSVTGEVLFEKDAYTKRGMASTTKILTGLIAIETLDKNDVVSVSPYAAGIEGSSIWLSPGEKISVESLLYGLLLSSGNDAATALAEYSSGSESAFTLLMNKRAKEIGCGNSNFTNPHGLPDDNHYTTCYDLAKISATAMENETFREIVATRNKQIPWEGNKWNRSLKNHNKLLKMRDYFIGIKTGYTKKDGRCLVSSARMNGSEIIIVTLSATDDWNDHIRLCEYIFNKYPPVKIIKKGESAGIKSDIKHRFDDIHTSFTKDFTITIPQEKKSLIKATIDYSFKFPVKKGDKVGVCRIFCQNREIAKQEIIATNNSNYKNDFFTVFKELAKGLINK